MTLDSIHNSLRRLAKLPYYQSLYSSAKELHLRLFENETDFSDIQILFINYMSYYYSLLMDVAMFEVSEEIFEHPIFEDAWSHYKRKKREKEHSEMNKQYKKNQVNSPQQEASEYQATRWIVKNSPSRKYK